MNRIEITTGPDGKGWVVHQDGKNSGILCYGEMLEQVIALMPPYDGKHYPMRTDAEWEAGWRRMAKPDRITITLTEREAYRVCGVAGNVAGVGLYRDQTDEVWEALDRLVDYNGDGAEGELFYGEVEIHGGEDTKGDRYAHAERMDLLTDPPQKRIRLTMDRDVAVTLRHLLECVRPLGELLGAFDKLQGQGIFSEGRPRFTGTIKWKKRPLTLDQLEVGKAYKLLHPHDEWEPVE